MNSDNQFRVNQKKTCFYCVYSFDHLPIGAPHSYSSTNQTYQTTGSFCSYECCLAYMTNNINLSSKTLLLHSLYRREYGWSAPRLKPAPPIETLELFGGCLTYEKFQEKSGYSFLKNEFRCCHHPSIIVKTKEVLSKDDYIKKYILAQENN